MGSRFFNPIDKNEEVEPAFRNAVIDLIKEHVCLPHKEVINAGAELSGISTMTASRYLDKMTSMAGKLKKITIDGKTMVILNPKHYDQNGSKKEKTGLDAIL